MRKASQPLQRGYANTTTSWLHQDISFPHRTLIPFPGTRLQALQLPIAGAEALSSIGKECPLRSIGHIRDVAHELSYWLSESSRHLIAHQKTYTLCHERLSEKASEKAGLPSDLDVPQSITAWTTIHCPKEDQVGHIRMCHSRVHCLEIWEVWGTDLEMVHGMLFLCASEALAMSGEGRKGLRRLGRQPSSDGVFSCCAYQWLVNQALYGMRSGGVALPRRLPRSWARTYTSNLKPQQRWAAIGSEAPLHFKPSRQCCGSVKAWCI